MNSKGGSVKKILLSLLLFSLSGSVVHAVSVCDVNNDDTVGLEEAVYALQIAAGQNPLPTSVCDINENGNTGIEEAIYVLEVVSGIRTTIPPNTVPYATTVSITGESKVGETLTGNYTYSDADLDAEGASVFRWLRYDDAGCTSGETLIGSDASYLITTSDEGKWIRFEVTPVATTGVSPGVSVISAATSTIAGLIPPDYVLRWKLNNNGNCDTSAFHLSSTSGDPEYSTTGPKEGSHFLSLNGDDHLFTPVSYDVTTNAISISMWLYLDPSSSEDWPTALDSGRGLCVYYDKSKDSLRAGITASQTANLASFIKGVWYHIVMTSDTTSQISLFVNGNPTPVDSWDGSYDITNFNDPWYIGSYSGIDFWPGYIDDVIIYNRAISGSEISDIYTSYH